MPDQAPFRRALVSVSDKSRLDVLARLLVLRKLEVLSTGGTADALASLGVAVVKVSEYTGSPEILDGRVKTLHPRIHGGILALPTSEHDAELAREGIAPIDLVVVNLYPFCEVVRDPACTFARAVENIDVGGPTMLRAAAKNWQRVTVVVDPDDYVRLAEVLSEPGSGVPESLRRELSRKAFEHTATYDAAIAQWLAGFDEQGEPLREGEVPAFVAFAGKRVGDLRYGENPHQPGAFVPLSRGVGEPPGLDAVHLHQGKALSYNNLLDADAALGLVRDLAAAVATAGTPAAAAVVVKHASPCGAAVGTPGEAIADVYVRARDADAESAFGGIVALSLPVDAATAEALTSTFLEVVIAPGYTAEARVVLARKANLRVLELLGMHEPSRGPAPLRARSVAGGMLVQREDRSTRGVAEGEVVTKRAPTATELVDLELAWLVAKHVRSNAIVLAREGATVGIGGGQTSRVESVRGAIARAGERARGAALASDGFFPFRDGVDAAVAAGATAVAQPGGSMRDAEVVVAADEHGIAMVLVRERHFRH